jgi:phosphoserine phosphatase
VPRFQSVLFDCDSTLSEIEGIEELAVAHREEIVALTEAAMLGAMPLEAVYGRRLAIIRPTRQAVERVGEMYVERLVAGARDVVASLTSLGIDVRIISGGLLPAVLRVARELDIPDDRVAAVDIFFDARGAYAGFDETSPLARQRGKALVIAAWSDLARPTMLVGDGATDLEARSVVDRFVAFAGVVERPNVTAHAEVVIRGLSLLPVLALALDGTDVQQDRIRELVARGLALLG